MSRAQLTSTVEQNTGGAVSPYVAGKNFAINGGFDIAQRGTSFTNTGSGTYTLDRWTTFSASSTAVVSQQSSGAPNGSQYYARVTYNSASSYYNMHQFVETANVSALWGRTVTLSAKMRKNATLTTNFNFTIAKSATVNAGISGTWTTIGSTTVANSSLSSGTSASDWVTVTTTVAIPNDGTANTLRLGIEEISAGVSGAYYEVAQVQLEIGSVATPFSRAGGTLSGELAACQRYYYRSSSTASNPYALFTQAFGANSSTQVYTSTRLPVSMRIPPTAADYANLQVADGSNLYAVTSIVLDANTSTQDIAAVGYNVSSGLTQYRPYAARGNNSSSAYLGFSAEL